MGNFNFCLLAGDGTFPRDRLRRDAEKGRRNSTSSLGCRTVKPCVNPKLKLYFLSNFCANFSVPLDTRNNVMNLPSASEIRIKLQKRIVYQTMYLDLQRGGKLNPPRVNVSPRPTHCTVRGISPEACHHTDRQTNILFLFIHGRARNNK